MTARARFVLGFELSPDPPNQAQQTPQNNGPQSPKGRPITGEVTHPACQNLPVILPLQYNNCLPDVCKSCIGLVQGGPASSKPKP
jgi:hypothetical protein